MPCRSNLTAEQFGSPRGPGGPYTVSPAQLSHPSRPLESLHRAGVNFINNFIRVFAKPFHCTYIGRPLQAKPPA